MLVTKLSQLYRDCQPYWDRSKFWICYRCSSWMCLFLYWLLNKDWIIISDCDDAFAAFSATAGCIALGLGSWPTSMFFICFAGGFLYYCAHWQTFCSGCLQFGRYVSFVTKHYLNVCVYLCCICCILLSKLLPVCSNYPHPVLFCLSCLDSCDPL